jgi:hypothetical protein
MYSRSGSGNRHYSFSEQDPGSTGVVGSVPGGCDLETLCEEGACRNKEIASDKAIPAHVLAVSSRHLPNTKKSDDSTSAGGLRIEPRSRHSVPGKRSREKSSRRDSPNLQDGTAT